MPTIALLLLLAAPVHVDLPFEHLKFKEGVHFQEGSRGIGDAFPYLEAHVPKAARPVDLTPATLRGLLATKITTPEAAYEAVRLFVPGVPVENAMQNGKRLIEEGKKLGKELNRLRVKLRHAPAKTPWKRRVEKTDEGWSVEFVAYEMDRVLRLAWIRATVKEDGTMKIERDLIIDGPPTVWQTALVEDDAGKGDADAQIRAEKERKEEALLARRRFAAALGARRDRDTAFVIARLRLTPNQIADVWPRERIGVGSGRRLLGVDLIDGTLAVYDATDPKRPVTDFTIMKPGKGPLSGTILLRLAVMQ
jgi:hypothetical protein